MTFLFFLGIAIFLIVCITRPLTTLFHELGHAIPAILLTGKKVTIYVGSHGDPKNSLRINLGLLEIWFKYNFLDWRAGLCIPSADNISANKKIIYTLCGPIASLVVATLACYYAFTYDWHGVVKLTLIILFCSAIVDLFSNLNPYKHPIVLHNGQVTYNDGYSLLWLFRYKRLPKEYREAVDFYNNQEYEKAAPLFESVLKKGKRLEDIYRLTASSYLMTKDYSKSLVFYEELQNRFSFDADDYVNAGLAKFHTGSKEECFTYYQKALELNPDHSYALNNLGYELTVQGKFEEAIEYLNKAIVVNPAMAYAYNNRGLAKVELGQLDEGLKDIQHSIELDAANSYGYRNLGIYHLKKNEKEEALKLFQKAKELDETTLMIDDLINNLQA
jgi:tetratricopeptide (TPR) repeat protein